MTASKPVSEKRLAANRANARKSTGPRTPEGRAASRWNALQHGVLARAVIPPALEKYESRADFSFLLQTLHEELDPQSALEDMLVERIATSYWRLARLLRAEAGMIAERQERRERDMAHDRHLRELSTGVNPITKLSLEIDVLGRVMDNPKRLRALMVEEDEHWRTAPEEELRAAAEKRLASLYEQKENAQAQEVAIEQAQRSIPPLRDTLPFARYEAALERQIYRALTALERLRLMRSGVPVPPPVSVTVDGIPPA